MKVKLIDYTGSGAGDPADYAARLLVYVKNTRLEQGAAGRQRIAEMPADAIDSQLSDIANTIRSSWEFVDYTFEVSGVSRAFTHQFVRSRHASFAQQAMWVADMSIFETRLPETVVAAGKAEAWELCMAMIASVYKELRAAGIAAQDARGVLPTNVLTNIIAKFNLRAFADLVGKRLNMRAQDEYTEVVQAMAAEVLAVHPWAQRFIAPQRTATPALEAIMKEKLNGQSPVDLPQVNAALKEIDRLKAVWG